MYVIVLLPFFFQAVCIGIDEVFFHYKRGLPKWERIGHPLDTFSVILCMLFVIFIPYSTFNLKIYIALAILSTILVTKDEFVHKEHCPPLENWLHALLFSLHPLTLLSAGLIWPVVQKAKVPFWLMNFLDNPAFLAFFLKLQASVMVLFCLYQIIYWNLLWKEKTIIKY